MNFKMVLSIAVLVLISTLNLWGQKPTEEDPFLLWQTTDPLGYSGFLIHPNGNIIANRNCEFFEIDGNTGALLKTYPVHYGYSDIESVTLSPDGKYFAATYWGADSGNTFIFDCQTGEVFRKFPRMGDNIRFMSDSKRILITTFDRGHPNASLSLYNIEDGSFKSFGAGFSSEGFAELGMSEDGRYFATGGRKKETVGLEEKTFVYLRLWDAQTLKPIKQLAKIEGNSEVTSINFSSDSKYVGFRYDYLVINLYNVENFELIKSYENVGAFGLFSKNLIGVFMAPGLVIKDFISNKDLFETTNTSGGSHYYIKYNTKNNSLIYGGGILRALDLNKILTSVPELPEKNHFTVQYKKRTLILTDFNPVSNQIKITISDINGRIIRKLDSPVSGPELKIPLIIPNGTYLIHIQDGNKEYSSKFLVAE